MLSNLCSINNSITVVIFILIVNMAKTQQYTLPPVDGETTPKTFTYMLNGEQQTVPRGIFHYSNTENDFGGSFKVPSNSEIDPLHMISDVLNSAFSVEQKRKQLSGMNLPLPFGLSPLNLQVAQEQSTGYGTNRRPGRKGREKETRRSQGRPMTPAVRQLFREARTQCLKADKEACDRAMEKYQRARFGGTDLENKLKSEQASPHEPVQFVQSEMAKWLLPSLDGRLEDMKTGQLSTPSTVEEQLREKNPELPSTSETPPDDPEAIDARSENVEAVRHSSRRPLGIRHNQRPARTGRLTLPQRYSSSEEYVELDTGRPNEGSNPFANVLRSSSYVNERPRSTTVRPYKTPMSTSKSPSTITQSGVDAFLERLRSP